MSTIPKPVSKPDFSEAEWQCRQDLAACYRAFVHYGWTDLIYTHLSFRSPDDPQQYIINPYGLFFQEITASNLIRVDFDGNVTSGEYPYNAAGHAIHSAILKARPDVNVVLHSHTRAGIAVSCMDCGLLPISQHANEIGALVCTHAYDVATDNAEECRRLGEDLGDKWLMIMHNHGLLATGRNVAEAFHLLYTLEVSCKVQVDVLASGATPIYPPQSAIDRLNAENQLDPAGPLEHVEQNWRAVRRMLDQKDPSYRS